MTNELLTYIRALSVADTKTLSQKALKAAEEVGELAKWVLPYDNAFATTHRFVDTDKILEEVADVMLTAMSIAYDLEVPDAELFAMMHKKAQKWEMLQQKSSVGYPLPYEIHVTILLSERDIDRFKDACSKIGVKPIVLDLQNRGGARVMGDVMTSSKHIGNNRTAYEEAMRIKDSLDLFGFDVVRTKIETVPWHPAAPTDITQEIPKCCHFETHIPVHIRIEDIPDLRPICEDLSLHLSRNVYKRNDDGTVVVMTTFRSRDFTSVGFQAHAQVLRDQLAVNGFILGKSVVEFCVYDTKNGHDSTWLTSN